MPRRGSTERFFGQLAANIPCLPGFIWPEGALFGVKVPTVFIDYAPANDLFISTYNMGRSLGWNTRAHKSLGKCIREHPAWTIDSTYGVGQKGFETESHTFNRLGAMSR